MQTENAQLYRQAQRVFTEARLRKESGAAIAENEYNNDALMYFAQPGDTEATLTRKKKSRQEVLKGLKISAGRAYKQSFPDEAGATVSGTVKMRAPDGTTQDVPADQVEHYKSKGATVVK